MLQLDEMRENRKHEKAFTFNLWHYSKRLLEVKAGGASLSCTSDEAFAKECGSYVSFPEWIGDVMPILHGDEFMEFDMSPITPAKIKGILKKRPSGLTPG